jgi:hypothetical protein
MQKFQDPETGLEWHFEDGVNPHDYPSTPKKLTDKIVPQPSPFHTWSKGKWVLDATGKKAMERESAMIEISKLEAQITPRRLLEHSLGMDTKFLPELNTKLETLRAKLGE